MLIYAIKWLVFCCSLCRVISVTATKDWTPEFLTQTRKANCLLGNIERDVTFLHGTDSGNFKNLGKVADMDVCVLLCCEMEKCEAAFMANRNCFAVECHSREHCATAPAHMNKYHPSVVFIKRIKHVASDRTTDSSHKGEKTTLAVKSNEGVKLFIDPDSTKDDIRNHSRPSGIATKSNEGMGLAVDSSHQTKNNVIKDGLKKEPAEVSDEVKHTKIPETPMPEIVDSLTIPDKSKMETVKMEEKKTEPTLNEHQTWRQKKLKKSRDSLVSAAVVTCSMAFLLSFTAMVAAKIRRRKESTENPEYTTVSSNEQ